MYARKIARKKLILNEPTLELVKKNPAHAKLIIKLACLKEFAASRDEKYISSLSLAKGNIILRYNKLKKNI